MNKNKFKKFARIATLFLFLITWIPSTSLSQVQETTGAGGAAGAGTAAGTATVAGIGAGTIAAAVVITAAAVAVVAAASSGSSTGTPATH